MVSDEEARRTIARGDYYAILPMLPELIRTRTSARPPVLTKEFSSGDEVLDLEGTRGAPAQAPPDAGPGGRHGRRGDPGVTAPATSASASR